MFKLDFNIPESSNKINLKQPILLIGSCFSDDIGHKLSSCKFDSLSNPFGTIYNPFSIFKLLSNGAASDNIIENQGVHYHWDAHGVISCLDQQKTINLFNEKKNHTQTFLAKAKWLIVTLGTSMVYELTNGEIVANCHKVASSHFKKRFLSQEEIIKQFSLLHSYLSELNSELNIIFTVSPVRHIRDGLIDNNRSKAILIDAIHTISEEYENTCYFPSFEIVLDELRDYRYYATDRIHPSSEAIDYVWERFRASYFDSETETILKDWDKLRTAINHKPFHLASASHQKFLKNTLEKLEQMNEKIDVSVEIEQLRNQLQ
ncbi:GSCFA domain-containing protein [Ekhidna sp.]